MVHVSFLQSKALADALVQICGPAAEPSASIALYALLLHRASVCGWRVCRDGAQAMASSVSARRNVTLPGLLGLLPPEVCMDPEGTESAGRAEPSLELPLLGLADVPLTPAVFVLGWTDGSGVMPAGGLPAVRGGDSDAASVGPQEMAPVSS